MISGHVPTDPSLNIDFQYVHQEEQSTKILKTSPLSHPSSIFSLNYPFITLEKKFSLPF